MVASFVVVLLHKPAALPVGFVFLVEHLEAGIIAHIISLDESWEVQDQELYLENGTARIIRRSETTMRPTRGGCEKYCFDLEAYHYYELQSVVLTVAAAKMSSSFIVV